MLVLNKEYWEVLKERIMGDVKDRLIDFVEAVMDHFELPDEEWDNVQDIILKKNLLEPTNSTSDVINYFEANIVCYHCHSLLGLECNCVL